MLVHRMIVFILISGYIHIQAISYYDVTRHQNSPLKLISPDDSLPAPTRVIPSASHNCTKQQNKTKINVRVGNPQGMKTHNHFSQIKYMTPLTRRVLLAPAGTGFVNKSDMFVSVGPYPVSHSPVATPSLTAW